MQSELDDFQQFIAGILIRNKSILDQATKLQDSCTHLNRTICKAATTCGCITIDAKKQPFSISDDLSIDALKALMTTQVEGSLCPSCESLLEKEIGRTLFYLGAIANTFNISLTEVLEKEKYRTELLGKFSLR